MTWKPKVIIAAVIVATSMCLTAFGVNQFIQSIGWLAAGYLFGAAQTTPK